MPASVIDRPPSAELRHDQRDDESLPSYDVLDRILEGYVEEDLDAVELVHRGLPPAEVERVIRMVDRAEYKRRQAPPGIKISTKAFGRDRRLPITNRHESTRGPGRAAAARAEVDARPAPQPPARLRSPLWGLALALPLAGLVLRAGRARAPTWSGSTTPRTSGSCSRPRP